MIMPTSCLLSSIPVSAIIASGILGSLVVVQQIFLFHLLKKRKELRNNVVKLHNTLVMVASNTTDYDEEMTYTGVGVMRTTKNTSDGPVLKIELEY